MMCIVMRQGGRGREQRMGDDLVYFENDSISGKEINDYNYIIKIIIAVNADRYCVYGFYTILNYYEINL